MNINDISTQLLFATVPIHCETNQGLCVGTGFFYSHKIDNKTQIPFLVTNHHVIRDAIHGYFEINLADGDQPSNEVIKVNFDHSFVSNRKLGNLDLAAMPIAPVLNVLEQNGKKPFYKTVENNLIPSDDTVNQLTALEDITFIGYPSGIFDDVNKMPLIRHGKTASPIWNDYQGNEEFIIDASVFPGSSGSPAFIFNQGSYSTGNGITIGSRLMFVGVVTKTIMRDGKEYLDLGRVIKSSAMNKEIEKLVSNLLS